ncbi:MAG: 50S ribosomal protein L3 [Candidatus Goldbacteria bacterium]|nr:50S ribosomal protein L3 [Candidatus Goldiibacteriota bacterium]
MLSTIIGKKRGMTQIFNSNGDAIPVTIVEFEDAIVVDKLTEEKNGYNAIKIGIFNDVKPKNISKPIKGIFKNEKKGLDLPFKKVLKEIRVEKSDLDKINIGDKITFTDVVKEGDYVDVSGISKGKGTQGVMKRHNFSGGVGSHGGMSHRRPGSIGSNTFPAHVWRGKRMAGHMGCQSVTVQNLVVEKFNAENKFLLIRGALPGPNGSIVIIKKAIKKTVKR